MRSCSRSTSYIFKKVLKKYTFLIKISDLKKNKTKFADSIIAAGFDKK